jgi:hypothetical protein
VTTLLFWPFKVVTGSATGFAEYRAYFKPKHNAALSIVRTGDDVTTVTTCAAYMPQPRSSGAAIN